ncbi:hypothetical protein BgiMline_028353 [Biomphalaria glabrata]|nr:hypothetical protein BgiBS90_032477 [Biomphalaria glabrata]KAI8753604.1 hypothetical protein BgiMline_014159 [Biomphalaria glabrata]
MAGLCTVFPWHKGASHFKSLVGIYQIIKNTQDKQGEGFPEVQEFFHSSNTIETFALQFQFVKSSKSSVDVLLYKQLYSR